jgi:CRP/FNR family cyclic AMP-dependent transcriptional regulator
MDQGTGFFGHFSQEDVAALRALAITDQVPRGQEVFHRGDEAARLYWVEQGQVRVVVTSPAGRDLVIRQFGSGEVFGEIALFAGTPRTATIVATTDTTIASVDARDLRSLLEERPRMALKLLEVFADRLRLTTDALEDSYFLTMRARLAKMLLSLAEEIGERTESGLLITEPVSQSLLARLVYATREEVNRELRRWERKGWLRRDDNLFELIDLDAVSDLLWNPRKAPDEN